MYKIVNQSDSSAEILLYSLITGGLTANRIIQQLTLSGADNITLHINSDGGEVFEAIALYNYLKDKNVNVVIDGICASAASIVAMSGKTITMKQGSMMMIHAPFTVMSGDAGDLRAQADVLDKITASMSAIYAAKSGRSPEEIMSLMESETWMTDVEALNAGFVDSIDTTPDPEPEPESESESAPEPAASYDDGIKSERERIRQLDELYTPERAEILNRAKYETGETADQIALELLRAERHTPERQEVQLTNIPVARQEDDIAAAIAEAINALRR